MKTDGSEFMARFLEDSRAELYFDGSKKFETTSTGIDVTGQVKADELYLLDNEYIKVGTGGDLQIHHDGSNSFIKDTGTGSLVINTNALYINNAANTENIISAGENGNVELYHDNVKKFETTSTGAAINGGRITSSQPMAAYYGCNNTTGVSGWKTIQWRVQEDRDSITISNSNSRFTPDVAGWYMCQFNHYHSNGTHSDYYLEIKISGAYSPAYQKFVSNFSANITTVAYFNGSSDYAEFRTHHSISAHNTDDSYVTNMRMFYLSN